MTIDVLLEKLTLLGVPEDKRQVVLTRYKEVMDIIRRDLDEVKKNGMALGNARYKTKEIIKGALEQNPMALRFLDASSLPESIVLDVLRRNGMAIEHVKQPTHAMRMAAVMSKGSALQFISQQDNDVCMRAIQEFPGALQHVKHQNPEMIALALSKDINTLKFVDFSVLA